MLPVEVELKWDRVIALSQSSLRRLKESTAQQTVAHVTLGGSWVYATAMPIEGAAVEDVSRMCLSF
jgi:hypothetical protein